MHHEALFRLGKLLLLLTLIGSASTSVNGQWHYKSCGVADIYDCSPEEFECLWDKASKNVTSGIIATGVGTSCLVAGIIIYSKAYAPSGDMGHALIGGALIIGGVIVDGIGISTWKVGANRKTNLRRSPYYVASHIPTLHVAPILHQNHLNNRYSLAIYATLRF